MDRFNTTWRRGALSSWLLALLVFAGCSTNPATGKSQIALVSEQQEIAMGKEADQQVQQQLVLFGSFDAALTPLVYAFHSGLVAVVLTAIGEVRRPVSPAGEAATRRPEPTRSGFAGTLAGTSPA